MQGNGVGGLGLSRLVARSGTGLREDKEGQEDGQGILGDGGMCVTFRTLVWDNSPPPPNPTPAPTLKILHSRETLSDTPVVPQQDLTFSYTTQESTEHPRHACKETSPWVFFHLRTLSLLQMVGSRIRCRGVCEGAVAYLHMSTPPLLLWF